MGRKVALGIPRGGGGGDVRCIIILRCVQNIVQCSKYCTVFRILYSVHNIAQCSEYCCFHNIAVSSEYFSVCVCSNILSFYVYVCVCMLCFELFVNKAVNPLSYDEPVHGE